MSRQQAYENVQISNSVPLKPLQSSTVPEQHYASLGKSKKCENEYADIQPFNRITTQITADPPTRGKKKSQTSSSKCLRASAAIAILIACLALVGVIIVAGVYVIGLQKNNVTLTNQIMQLEAKVNMIQGDQTPLVMAQQQVLQSVVNGLNETRNEFNNQLNSLLTSVNTTTIQLQYSVDTTTTQLSSLQSSVDTLTTARDTTTTQLSSLQSSVDTLTTARDTTTTQLSSLQSSVDSLTTARATTTTQLSSLQSSVDTLTTARDTTTTQLSSLQSSVDTLTTARDTTTTQLSSLQSSVNTLTTARDTTTTQLSSLQSSVNTLNTRVNPPYQNCIQETRNCTISRTSSTIYWEDCYTNFIPINIIGYYTTDMRCEYEASITYVNQETHILRKIGNTIQCQCHLSRLSETSSAHLSLDVFDSTCSLVVTRCPE